MFPKIFKPSRWSGGVSLLWNGSDGLFSSLFSSASEPFPANIFLFDSARNALFHYLLFKGHFQKRAYVCSFTCSAVTDVFKDLKCELSLYHLTDYLGCKSKPNLGKDDVLLNQVSFGVSAFSDKMLDCLNEKTLVIDDLSLSYGAGFIANNQEIKRPAVISFECSKSITFGWAGALFLPMNEGKSFEKYYQKLKRPNFFEDLLRVLIAEVNIKSVKYGNKILFLFWIFFRLLGLQRKSEKSSSSRSRAQARLGTISQKILHNSWADINRRLEKSNNIHSRIANALKEKEFCVVSKVNTSFSSPRVCFQVDHGKDKIKSKFFEFSIECGDWFSEPPTEVRNDEDQQMYAGSNLGKYLNLPCQYTISDRKIQKILNVIDDL